MMHRVHSREHLLINLIHHDLKLFADPEASDTHSEPAAEELRQRELGGLVINDLALFLRSLLRRELSPDTAVSDRVPRSDKGATKADLLYD